MWNFIMFVMFILIMLAKHIIEMSLCMHALQTCEYNTNDITIT